MTYTKSTHEVKAISRQYHDTETVEIESILVTLESGHTINFDVEPLYINYDLDDHSFIDFKSFNSKYVLKLKKKVS